MRVTIVVPVWNRQERVVRTLDSIAASICHHFELVVVDNGSTDDSLAVCQQWAWTHRDDGFPIQVLSELRQGAAAARNRGLQACQTEYVYFFDSDDLMSPDFVGDVMEVLYSTSPDMLFAPVCMEVRGQKKVRDYVRGGDVPEHIITSMMDTLSMVFNTQWLRGIGGWNESVTVWDDWELGARALLAKPTIYWMEGKTYHQVLVHDESLTGACFSQSWQAQLQALRSVLVAIKHAGRLTDDEHRRCLRSLYLRVKIGEGFMRCERCQEGTAAYRQLAKDIIPHPSKPLLMCGMLLSSYTAVGGRGAWRLALRLC